jgi:hypothetical protein
MRCPIQYQARDQQEELFKLDREFELVEQTRDLLEELMIIKMVYEDQLGIVEALADGQYRNALILGGYSGQGGDSMSLHGGIKTHWNKLGCFKSNKKPIVKRQGMVDGMIKEATRISDSVSIVRERLTSLRFLSVLAFLCLITCGRKISI